MFIAFSLFTFRDVCPCQTIPLHQAGIPDNPVSLREKGRHGCVLRSPYLSATSEPLMPTEGINVPYSWFTLSELWSTIEIKTNRYSQVSCVYPSAYDPGNISFIRPTYTEDEGQRRGFTNCQSPWCLYKQVILTTACCLRLAYGRRRSVQTSKSLAALLQTQLRASREMGRLARASRGHQAHTPQPPHCNELCKDTELVKKGQSILKRDPD